MRERALARSRSQGRVRAEGRSSAVVLRPDPHGRGSSRLPGRERQPPPPSRRASRWAGPAVRTRRLLAASAAQPLGSPAAVLRSAGIIRRFALAAPPARIQLHPGRTRCTQHAGSRYTPLSRSRSTLTGTSPPGTTYSPLSGMTGPPQGRFLQAGAETGAGLRRRDLTWPRRSTACTSDLQRPCPRGYTGLPGARVECEGPRRRDAPDRRARRAHA